MIEANKFKLGLFVISSLILGLVLLFLFGWSEALETKVSVYTYFDESVQGLEIGSPVKYRGVTIGRVKRIAIRDNKLIRVEMDIMPESFDSQDLQTSDRNPDFDQKNLKQSIYDFLAREIPLGMRCHLEFAGITGLKFIEINYFDKNEDLDLVLEDIRNPGYIPSHKSLITDTLSNVHKTIEKISNVDFEGLVSSLQKTFSTFNNLLEEKDMQEIIPSLKNTSQQIEKLTATLSETITAESINTLTAELSTAFQSLEEAAETIQNEVKKAELNRLSKDISEKSEKIADGINSGTGSLKTASNEIVSLRTDIAQSLGELNTTLQTLRELILTLEEDPSSILRGKQKQSVFSKTQTEE